jgi:hypothetical protein
VKTLVEEGFSDSISRFNLGQKYKFHKVWFLDICLIVIPVTVTVATPIVQHCSFVLILVVFV